MQCELPRISQMLVVGRVHIVNSELSYLLWVAGHTKNDNMNWNKGKNKNEDYKWLINLIYFQKTFESFISIIYRTINKSMKGLKIQFRIIFVGVNLILMYVHYIAMVHIMILYILYCILFFRSLSKQREFINPQSRFKNSPYFNGID